jgi:hypothetical protein
VHHADEGAAMPAYRELIEQLRGEVEAWREEARRKDHIIAGLIERLPPQLEPPAPPETPEPREPGPHRVWPERAEPVEPVDPHREEPERVEPERVEPERVEPERVEPERVEPRESPETVDSPGPRETPTDASGSPQEGTQPRSWWRRMFGG